MEKEEKMKILRNWGERTETIILENDSMLGLYLFILSVTMLVILLLLNES